MALDIRMDFISNIDPNYVEKIVEIRKGFVAIDDLLKGMAHEAHIKGNAAAARCIALARTSNEQVSLYTIKSFCLLGETKE